MKNNVKPELRSNKKNSHKKEVEAFLDGMKVMQNYIVEQIQLRICADYLENRSCIHTGCKSLFDLNSDISGESKRIHVNTSK